MGCTACTEPDCLYEGALYLYLFYGNFETESPSAVRMNFLNLQNTVCLFCTSWMDDLGLPWRGFWGGGCALHCTGAQIQRIASTLLLSRSHNIVVANKAHYSYFIYNALKFWCRNNFFKF